MFPCERVMMLLRHIIPLFLLVACVVLCPLSASASDCSGADVNTCSSHCSGPNPGPLPMENHARTNSDACECAICTPPPAEGAPYCVQYDYCNDRVSGGD